MFQGDNIQNLVTERNNISIARFEISDGSNLNRLMVHPILTKFKNLNVI